MRAVVVIPARYGSSRFPGKPLVPLKGRPLLQHTFERARGSRLAREVLIATDDERIQLAAEGFGARVIMTGKGHVSGTDRVAEAAGKIDADIFVNLQGDEPLIRPAMIDDVIMLLEEPGADISTLASRIIFGEHPEDYTDPNVVKTVFDKKGFALYFSRSPIPHGRGGKEPGAAYKHLGIYGYKKEALLRLAGLPPTPLEESEGLEQLRALEHGMRIRVKETGFDTIGVDTPQDLEKVERWLNSYS